MRRKGAEKPKWPHSDTGVTMSAHPGGQWVKRVDGKLHYFGVWTDPDAALELYASKFGMPEKPPERRKMGAGKPGTLRFIYNSYLFAQRERVDRGELSARQYQSHIDMGKAICKVYGDMKPESMGGGEWHKVRALFQHHSPSILAGKIRRIKTCMNWAIKNNVIGFVRYGDGLDPPPKRLLRKARLERGPQLFPPDELRDLIHRAATKRRNRQLEAMTLLGINCGFYPVDCARLEIDVCDLGAERIDWIREKVYTLRRCPLWPETVDSLRDAIGDRTDGLVFRTAQGRPWVRTETAKSGRIYTNNEVGKAFKKLNPSLPFKALRHTFRTVADEVRDTDAARLIMGHNPDDIDAVYIQRIGWDRLKKVSDHVRSWLFG